MGTFHFDYTKAAAHAAPRREVKQEEKVHVKAQEKVQEKPVERPVQAPVKTQEPHRIVRGVPRDMPRQSRDGKSVLFHIQDARSETGVGYLSTPAASVHQSGNSLSIDLGTRDRMSGMYGIQKSGRFMPVSDSIEQVADRLSKAVSIFTRHRQADVAGRQVMSGFSRGKDDESWQR